MMTFSRHLMGAAVLTGMVMTGCQASPAVPSARLARASTLPSRES